jgi:hypothetical protein
MRKPRKPKTGRTADEPAELSPAAVFVWTKRRLAVALMRGIRFAVVNYGREWTEAIVAHELRKSRERSIKGPSDNDMALVRRYLTQKELAKERGEKAKPTTLARRAARAMAPEDPQRLGINTNAEGESRLVAIRDAILRAVDRHERSENAPRAAMKVPDPLTIVCNIDELDTDDLGIDELVEEHPPRQ